MLRNIFKAIFSLSAIIIGCGVANAYSSSYYTTNSKLSTGHWAKVRVSEIGMQEISHEQLRQLGFSDPSKVCVYGYGGALLTKNTFSSNLPDDLIAQPVYYGDDKIVFYGEPDLRVNIGKKDENISILRNMYSLTGYYFLSDCDPNASKQYNEKKYDLSNILSREYHTSTAYIENEYENPGKGGTFFFDKSLLIEPTTYSFKLPKPYTSNGNTQLAYLRYNYAAKVPSYVSLDVHLDIPESLISEENHNSVIPSSLSSQYYYTSSGEINFYPINAADTTYTVTFTLPTTNATYAAIDNIYVNYLRKNDFNGESQMMMTFTNGVNANYNFIISNANANVKVWNVSTPTNIFSHALKYSDSSKNAIGTFDKSYEYSSMGNACLIAFDPTQKMHQVEVVGNINNQNLHGLETPEMVIITNKFSRPYAEKVAQAHRDYQNLDVIVVDQEEIFNEFSSGTPTAMGYRRFLKMFYDRNKDRFKYLLLFGEGSWDNRGAIYPKEDRLLTYQAEAVEDARSAAKAFCGDSYFGMLNDDYDPELFYSTPAQIAVGRIPAQNAIDAQAITNKIINYLQNPPTQALFNHAIILADEGDSHGHISQQEENIGVLLSAAPEVTCTRAYNSLYPANNADAAEARDCIKQALCKGQGFFSFAGHGGATSFTGKKLWSISAIKETSYQNPPIAMFATCDAFSFDRGDAGMAEQGLYKEDGGFIAIVAASRTVYMQFNQYLNRAFTRELYSANGNDMIGDVYLRARNFAATEIVDRTLGVNTMCYNLAGDPALPIYKPTLGVKTTTVNDNTPDGETYHLLTPLAKNSIKGEITDSKGNTLESFNGEVTLEIFDAPSAYSIYTKNKVITTEYNDTILTAPATQYVANDSLWLCLDENLLTQVTVPVTNGKFDASFVIPTTSKPNSINRVSYFAIDDSKKMRAIGVFNHLRVNSYDADVIIDDTTAPVIEQCYINEPSFTDGDVVDSDFVLYAVIGADETGINVSGNSFGSNATLVLDNVKTYPRISSAIESHADGSSSIAFAVTQVEDGKHTLTLSVSDNSGNRISRDINFVVINRSAQATLTVDNTPARTEATFDINHNFLSEPSGRLVIEDAEGNAIFSKTGCSFPYTWNLTDNNGKKVADGNYKASAILNGDKQYGATQKIDVIVIK